MLIDTYFYQTSVSRDARAHLKHQRPCAIWMTGLSGAGKSTIANALEVALNAQQNHTFLLDGDNIRSGLCRDLGFSDQAREENIRRVAEVTKLFVDAGLIVITAFISPFLRNRAAAREIIGEPDFIEVFIDTPLYECERRDPKGLYSKARNAQLTSFTGIDSAYEPPLDPDIKICTLEDSVEDAVRRILEFLQART